VSEEGGDVSEGGGDVSEEGGDKSEGGEDMSEGGGGESEGEAASVCSLRVMIFTFYFSHLTSPSDKNNS